MEGKRSKDDTNNNVGWGNVKIIKFKGWRKKLELIIRYILLFLKRQEARWYPTETITDVDDLALLANHLPKLPEVRSKQQEALTFTRTQIKQGSCLLSGKSLKLENQFIYLGSIISSPESDVNTRREKACTAIYKLSIIWKFYLSDKTKYLFVYLFGFMAYQLLGVIKCQIHFYTNKHFYFKQFSLA